MRKWKRKYNVILQERPYWHTCAGVWFLNNKFNILVWGHVASKWNQPWSTSFTSRVLVNLRYEGFVKKQFTFVVFLYTCWALSPVKKTSLFSTNMQIITSYQTIIKYFQISQCIKIYNTLLQIHTPLFCIVFNIISTVEHCRNMTG